MIRIIKEHFDRFRKMNPLTSCLKISVESLLLSIIVAIPLAMFVPQIIEDKRDLMDNPIQTILIAPFIETMFFQLAPVYLAIKCNARFSIQASIATAAFAIPHFAFGLAVGVSAGIIGGFYLSFLYAHWRNISLWTAVWTTTIAHSIRNFLALVLLWFFWHNWSDSCDFLKNQHNFCKINGR